MTYASKNPGRALLLALVGGGAVWLAVSALALTSACKVQPDPPLADRKQVLQDLAVNVVVATYQDVASETRQLSTAVSVLRQLQTADSLRAAQLAYRTARASQKMTEAFYFGPASDISVSAGAIDAWPTDAAKLTALLASSSPVTPSAVAVLGASQRGFPALEFLLFDSRVSDTEVLARFQNASDGARRLELSESLAGDLAELTQRVSDAFSKPDGYGFELANAGIGAKTLPSQSEGVDKIVTGLVYVSELMQMKKLADPLGVDNTKTHGISPTYEEGPRSDSSLADLQADLDGIKAIYTGQHGARMGKGLGDAVRDMNPGADQRFMQALDAAYAALAGIPPPFRTALLTNPAPIMAMYSAVSRVQQSLMTDIASSLGASIGFGFSDSD